MGITQRRNYKPKSKPLPYLLAYSDSEEFDEFVDVGRPLNLGRRRPRLDEWGDYIEEEQLLHIENLMSGELNDISGMTRQEIFRCGTLGNMSGA
jgi:hypothetical protein